MNHEHISIQKFYAVHIKRHRYANVLHLPQPIVQNSDHQAAERSLRLAAAPVKAAVQVEPGPLLGPVASEVLFGGWSAFADDNIQETLKLRRD